MIKKLMLLLFASLFLQSLMEAKNLSATLGREDEIKLPSSLTEKDEDGVFHYDFAKNEVDTFIGERWLPLGLGLRGDCYAITADGKGNIYAAGKLYSAGGNPVNNIAKWDGNSWEPLGLGVNGICHTIVSDYEGNIYVGGTFDEAGGSKANNIAMWNGTSWSSLGMGLDSSCYKLAIDEEGHVYAGGDFSKADSISSPFLAKWNGVGWEKVGSPVNGAITAIEVGVNGDVFAAGKFDQAGDLKVNGIAVWDGSNWSNLGAGIDGSCFNLKANGSGELFVGGSFEILETGIKTAIAKWNGKEWSVLGKAIRGFCFALELDGKGNLFAGGSMVNAEREYFKWWNGERWQRVDNMNFDSHCISICLDSNKRMYAAGGFDKSNTSPDLNGVAIWDDKTYWNPVGAEIKGSCNSMLVDQEDNLYIAGKFDSIGNVAVNNIAKWDGEKWLSLGSGLSGRCNVLTLAGDGSLYAGGEFDFAGSKRVSNIAKWDGEEWHPMGNGALGEVTDIIITSQNLIYANGFFYGKRINGKEYTNFLASWDGDRWKVVEELTNSPLFVEITNDHSENVYIAFGWPFTLQGKEYGIIVKWDGTSLTDFSTGIIDGSTMALEIDTHGDLYAIGEFQLSGENRAKNRIIKYANGEWSEFLTANEDSWITPYRPFHFDKNNILYTNVSYSGIVKVSDGRWHQLGMGFNGHIFDVVTDSKGNIYIGGKLTPLGLKPVNNVMKWNDEK